jgi:hypothetical protein
MGTSQVEETMASFMTVVGLMIPLSEHAGVGESDTLGQALRALHDAQQ